MQKLQQEISKVLFRISNDFLKDYYGSSKNALLVEKRLLDVGGTFDSSGWSIPSTHFDLSLPIDYLPKFARLDTGLDISGGNITTLKDRLPEEIKGHFNCGNTPLTSLEGCPSKVASFSCGGTKITSLKRGPIYKVGSYNCSHCYSLTSLEGSPSTVASFNCGECRNLATLEGGPSRVEGDYFCQGNALKTLHGSPRVVKGNFICERNQLSNLEGAPGIILKSLFCAHNYIEVGSGLPPGIRVHGEVYYDEEY